MAHFVKTGRKGHGCCCGVVTLILVLSVIVALLGMSTNLLDGVKHKVMRHFYPQDYLQSVQTYSQQYGVEESLVFAVIKTESGFDEQAQSSVGAMGLMQMMPDTFTYVQKMHDGEVLYSSDKLYNPDISIKYGTYYLSYLLEHYKGDEKLAVAAYNAGVTNVDNWLKDNNYSQNGKDLDNIPFEETEEYVEKVEKTQGVYETLYYDKK